MHVTNGNTVTVTFLTPERTLGGGVRYLKLRQEALCSSFTLAHALRMLSTACSSKDKNISRPSTIELS
jgi:hypothetical protein